MKQLSIFSCQCTEPLSAVLCSCSQLLCFILWPKYMTFWEEGLMGFMAELRGDKKDCSG